MNYDERQLLQSLFDRLRDSGSQPRDAEAEHFIADQVRYQPAAPYYMAQAVIVQEQALQESQARIAELEERIHQLETPRPATGQGGFLARQTGGMFGRGATQPAPAMTSRPASVPPAGGPWNRGPVMSQPQQQPQPSYGQPVQPPQPMASSGGGFLKGAIATAAGVAGGALLYDQLKGAFGGGSGQAQAANQQNQAQADQALDEMQDEQLAAEYDQDAGDSDSGGGDIDI